MGEVGNLDLLDLKAISTFIASTFLIYLAFAILYIVGLMKVYKKSGKPAWAALVPIYNIWVLFEIVSIPPWLCLVPIVNIFMIIYATYKLGAVFNKSGLFSLGLVFFSPIFLLILGFETNNKAEVELKPDLMVKDPASSGKVDLMERDPISSIPETPIVKEEPIIKEMPSLEKQMVIPKVIEPVVEQLKQPEVENIIENSSIPNAFEMTLPKLKEEVLETEVIKEELELNKEENNLPIEQLEITPPLINKEVTSTANLHKTQKFCPECGSPNDMLNKFCISCGYDFDKSN